MVLEQIEARGVHDKRVLAAMHSVPRHRFVPEQDLRYAYSDYPLPIGYHQTISQPYIVAYMCELAQLHEFDKVLEVGTGSGYNAAIMAQIVEHVYSIEIVAELARRARETITGLHYDNISIRHGDGYDGWKEAAPFDAIIVTAAAAHIPEPLIEQLVDGGRLVIPLGTPYMNQVLLLVEKVGEELIITDKLPVRFVPLTGRHGHGIPTTD